MVNLLWFHIIEYVVDLAYLYVLLGCSLNASLITIFYDFNQQ